SGYWWQGQPDGAPLPPPPNVPANGLWVSGSNSSQVAIAAVRFQLPPDEATPVLTAKVNRAFPPAQASAASNAGQVVVLATPSTDVAGISDVASATGAPATDFNFAANAVQPSAGVAASSTPSVAPGSLAPQTRGLAESSVEDNKGYRALAAILLGVLLWWAW